ncbi:hypothetical protein HMPREF1628_05030 [Actinomyces sp. S4-C9]|nr:hypothetical protein HMPREF1628_05030 [Actinomyces sp. S4-C9]
MSSNIQIILPLMIVEGLKGKRYNINDYTESPANTSSDMGHVCRVGAESIPVDNRAASNSPALDGTPGASVKTVYETTTRITITTKPLDNGRYRINAYMSASDAGGKGWRRRRTAKSVHDIERVKRDLKREAVSFVCEGVN